MIDRTEQEHLLAVLAWWRLAGVDAALTETAIDWTARPDAGPGLEFDWPERLQGAEATPPQLRPGAARAQDRGPAPLAAPPTSGSPSSPAGQSSAPSPAAPPSARPAIPRTPGAMAAPQPARAFPSPTPDAASMAARAAARQAPTLAALEASLKAFDGCGLKATAKSLCFFRGAPQARVMVVGEAPGREEDLEGRPFVGRSGQLLDKMLAAIGLGEADVHITNTVYWRPPGNRTPTPQETLVCRPFLERQIELVSPAVVITLGGPAAKAVLGIDDGILKVRGKWRDLVVGERTVRAMPTLHPAYLLRSPAAKRQAWRDLLAVKAALDAEPGST